MYTNLDSTDLMCAPQSWDQKITTEEPRLLFPFVSTPHFTPYHSFSITILLPNDPMKVPSDPL